MTANRWKILACGTCLLVGAFLVQLAADPPPAGRLSDRLGQFGVVGDGVADDSVAIQRMIDAKVGSLRFQKAVYRLSQTVVIDLDRVGFTSLTGDGTARFVMTGAGPAFKFVGTHTGNAGPNSFKSNVWENQRAPMVDGIEIVGGHPQAVGIEATGTMQLVVSRLVVREALHGVHLTGNNRNIILSDCQIYHNTGAGVFYDDVNLHQSNIVGCHISYNGGGGVVCRAGNVRNIHISGCDIESNHSRDGAATANVLIDCTGGNNGTAEVAITGCTLQHNSTSPDSANIRIFGKSGNAEREGHITISGNIFSDVRQNIHLRDCRGVAMTGNTFWMGFDGDLLVENCVAVVVGQNVLDRNPRYEQRVSAKGGIAFRNCADCTLQGNHVQGVHSQAAGLIVENCRRFNVTACTFLDCDNAGMLFDNVSHSRISDCLVRDDRQEGASSVSIKLTGGSGNQVLDNLLGKPAEIEAQSIGN